MTKTSYRLLGFGVAILGLGIWVGEIGFSELWVAQEHLKWKSVEGKVISSDIAGVRALHPDIAFAYIVDSIEYIGHTDLEAPGFGSRATRRDQATKLVALYPPGKLIPVYYDPNNPDHSVLKTSPPWSVFTKLGTGIFFVIIGAILLLRLLSVVKSGQPVPSK